MPLPRIEVEAQDLLKSDEETAYAVVVQRALTNRLDLMNQRAQVVDAWRQLAVSANSLQGILSVGYHLDSATPANSGKALVFAAERTRQQLFLNTELPLVR